MAKRNRKKITQVTMYRTDKNKLTKKGGELGNNRLGKKI